MALTTTETNSFIASICVVSPLLTCNILCECTSLHDGIVPDLVRRCKESDVFLDRAIYQPGRLRAESDISRITEELCLDPQRQSSLQEVHDKVLDLPLATGPIIHVIDPTGTRRFASDRTTSSVPHPKVPEIISNRLFYVS